MIGMIDWLSYTVKTEKYNDNINKIIEELENKKQMAIINRNENMSLDIIIKIGDYNFRVMPNGTSRYAYILRNDYMEIRLCKIENLNYYPIFVHISSMMLWSTGIDNSVKIVNKWISQNFGKILNDKVNRVDICCHTDLDIAYNVSQYKGKWVTTKKDKEEITEKRYTGEITTNKVVNTIYFGSRNSEKIYCRIYDKSYEIKKSNKLWFLDIWNDKKLNVDKITNIEFELHRKFFKDIKINGDEINTVDSVLKNLNSIWKYLTTKWLIMLDSPEYTRVDRAKISNIWLKVQNAFDMYQSTGMVERTKQMKNSSQKLFASLRGYMVSIAAIENVSTLGELYPIIQHKNWIYEKSKDKLFSTDVENRRKLLDVQW